MKHSKRPIKFCQELQPMFSRSYASKKEFLRDYRKFYARKSKAKEFYHLLLTQLEKAISEGKIANLKKLNNLIGYTNEIINHDRLRIYYDNINNPIRKTNLFILASQHNKVKILEYLFDSDSAVLSNLTSGIGRTTILPGDKDGHNHNAFYYAIRSENMTLLDLLINKWPDNYFAGRQEELEEIIANAYHELKLRNVLLSDEMQYFVEDKLLDHRLFSTEKQASSNADDLTKTRQRIQLLLESISLLKRDYSDISKVDGSFLYVIKFIARNVHILKGRLRSTYDKIPWEEIEFCLVIFVSSQTSPPEELNLFYRVVLSKEKIMNYLENFANKLRDEENVLKGDKLHRLPRGQPREEIVNNIIRNDPQFEGLYNDYHQVRDVYSLKRINDHVELAASADAREDQGQYVIIRVLQVIGEHLKNTLESPKLSHFTGELLVLSLSPFARKYIIELRDAISHADSLSKIMEIEENADVNFFINIQDDVRKVGDVITDIFYKNKIKTIKILLEKVVEIESLDEIKVILEDLDNAELDTLNLEYFKTKEPEKLEKLLKKLRDNIANKTDYENDLFNKINNIINCVEERLSENIRLDYFMGYKSLQIITYELTYNGYTNMTSIKILKSYTNILLNYINEKTNFGRFKNIAELLNKIFRSVESRIKNNNFFEVKRLTMQIKSIVQFETVEIKWIEKLNKKLNEKKPQKKINLQENKYNKQLELKVQELSRIVVLYKNLLSEFKINKSVQALVKMFVLDIMSILDSSKHCLSQYSILFLDDNAPVLHGRCLRNYLAHDNVIINVLLSDPLIAVILNAKKLTQENIMKSKKKIGKLVNDDPEKLRKKFHQDLETITNQERMFVALEEGHLDDLKNCLEKGADVKGRSTINSRTALHFAAKGPIGLEVIRSILDQNLSVNVKDNKGETPLHIAAAHGRQDLVNFFLKDTDIGVDVKNYNNETPLHVAARNGHKDIVEVLLTNKADIFTVDKRLRPPVYFAIRNNRIDITQLLLRKDLDFDVNETIGECTALALATYQGHLELVNFLIKNGADVDATNYSNQAPLHLVACNNHLEVMSALILQGANVNARDIDGKMPLHYAIANGNVKVVNGLLKFGAYANTPTGAVSPLHTAALVGDLEIVTVLRSYGAHVNAKLNDKNLTPLDCAAFNGNKEVVECLIQHGAQINPPENTNFNALHLAVMKGHKDVAHLLIKKNAKVNAEGFDGATAIHIAAINGNNEIIDLLIQNKADVNARCSNGLTPLHLAVKLGQKEIVKQLIDNNADVNLEYNIGNETLQPLHLAVVAGHKEIVDILIAKEANIDDNIVIPLHCAIKNNHKEIVELLIKKVAVVKEQNIFPWRLSRIYGNPDIVKTLLKNKAFAGNYDSKHPTPLHLAAMTGHTKVVEVLIENGADVSASFRGITPLLYAVFNGFEEVVEILIENGAETNLNNIAIHVAATRGHSKVVKVLLDNKPNIDINDNSKSAPIRLAAANSHLEVVKVFLQNTKVNIDAKDEDGFSLLHIASEGTNLDLVKYLIDEGSDINSTTSNGKKAIHLAAQNGFKECVEFFISLGLSVNEPGVLHCAAWKGRLEIVNYLIEQHADVNTKYTISEFTPMHFAAVGGYKAVIEVLLKNGAIYNAVNLSLEIPLKLAIDKDVIELLDLTDKLFKAVKKNSCAEVQNYITAGAVVNAKNTEGVRPLHYAAWKGYDEVARILLQNKANPNVVNNKGVSPLHYASKFSHLKVVKSLLSYYAVYNAVSAGGKTPSDFTKDKSITGLFRKVGYFFKNIETNNSHVIKHLKKIKDINTVKAIMCARNRENQTLVVAAIHNKFSKVQKLKEIAQGGISAQINEAVELFRLDHLQQAFSVFKDALKKRRDILGSDNPGTLDIQKFIARVLMLQCNYQEALNLLEEILLKEKEMLGFDSKETLETRSLIATIKLSVGEHEEAFDIFQEVYQKQKEILGPTVENTLLTRLQIATIFIIIQKKYEEGLNICRTVYDHLKSKNRITALYALGIVAMALKCQGNHEKALHIYKNVLEKQKEFLGINHCNTLLTLTNIAEVLRLQKKYNKSLTILTDVLNNQKQVLNPSHPFICDTQVKIGNVLFDQQKCIGAFKVYRGCYDQFKAVFGSNHPTVLYILNRMKIIRVILKYIGIHLSEILQNVQKIINIAASKGDMQTIQILLEDGADANDKDDDGRTPIHYAISYGHADVVNILLKHGADVTSVTNKGNTPLHTASSKGYDEIAEILLRSMSPDKLKNFINAKTTASGATSLHVTAQNGFLNIAMLLLKRGAIYNIPNNEGKTPLDLCTNQNFIIMLKLIEELFQDAKNGNVEIIDKLKVLNPSEYVAVTNACNDHNHTLLQVAKTNKHHNVARILSQMLKDPFQFQNYNN